MNNELSTEAITVVPPEGTPKHPFTNHLVRVLELRAQVGEITYTQFVQELNRLAAKFYQRGI